MKDEVTISVPTDDEIREYRKEMQWFENFNDDTEDEIQEADTGVQPE